MRMRNPKDKEEVLNSCNFFYNPEVDFLDAKPLHIEIGMGKGQFILNMALNNPHINFIGIEKYSSVASIAIKKIRDYDLPNLRILIKDAKDLKEVLEKKVDCLYLNFSDPWPKERHAKRRLTSPNFLKIYDELFKKDCLIIQKTDNDALFAYSIDSLKEYGYTIEELSYDLHQNIENVESEYEEKFREKGIKIKYLKARK